MNSVVLGGTCQRGDYDTSVRETDSRFIYEGCSRIFPALQVEWNIFLCVNKYVHV